MGSKPASKTVPVRSYASRKFLLACYTLAAGTVLNLAGTLDGANLATIFGAALLFYGGANVAAKHFGKE